MQGVYQIRNIKDNKVYIGSSVNMKQRWSTHVTELNGNRHHSSKLQEAWNEYGREHFSFEVLEEINGEVTRDELTNVEQKYIEKYKPHVNGYNIMPRATKVDKQRVSQIRRKDIYSTLHVESTVKQLGNSLAAILPSDYAKAMNLDKGSVIYISYNDGKITISRRPERNEEDQFEKRVLEIVEKYMESR